MIINEKKYLLAMRRSVFNKYYAIISIVIGLFTMSSELIAQEYKIIRSADKSVVDFDAMMRLVSTSDVIFFGEQHDDSLCHVIQYSALQWLSNNHTGTILSLEMFETDVQYIVDEYLSNLIATSSFEKDARIWSNYDDYRPMVEFQKSKNQKVIAANAPRRYVRMVSKNGLNSLQKLPKNARQYLPKLPIIIAKGRYLEKFNSIMGQHGGEVSSIYESQNLWDATMAFQIHKAYKKDKQSKILHLCGSFHCEEGLGTVQQLKIYNKKIKSAIIVGMSVANYEELSSEVKSSIADFIILTK